MKKFLVLLGAIVSIGVGAQQASADNGESVISALKEANVSKFSSYLDDFVDLKLPQKDEIKNVGKTQAGLTIKNFFSDAGVKGFALTSQRTMGSTTAIAGKLTGSNGQTYQITMILKNKGDSMSVITIRIS